MKTRRPLVMLALAAVLLGVPFVADRWLAARDARHAELLKMYECRGRALVCAADFNRNGTRDRLGVDPPNPSYMAERWLTVSDGERELLRVPYYYLDNTFRTHSAIYQPPAAEAPRLLIFNGWGTPPVKAVFAWDGETMREVAATSVEREILSALATRDETGGLYRWVAWRLASQYVLPVYLLIVGGSLAFLNFCWLRRGRRPLP